MELRNEINYNLKKNQKNIDISLPINYFDRSDIKKIFYSKNNKIQEGNGRLIEAYIDENRDVILSLKTDIIYGELLDITLFMQKDFNLLKAKMNEIMKKHNRFKVKKKKFDNKIITNDIDITEEEKEKYDYMYKKLKIKGTIMISDEEYTDELIKDIIDAAKNNDNCNQLPDIFIYFDKRMNEEKQ